jgi:GT2 family glycosyltransferase
MSSHSRQVNPSASVIVLTYNAHAFVERALSALAAQTFVDFETIVVDNASSDGTADFVRERFPALQVVASPRNGGYGAGNNLGASRASGDILVFLNPDAIPEPDWLEKLLVGMRSHGRKFATSKIVLQADPERLNSAGNLIHYLGLSFCRGLNSRESQFNSAEDVSSASGAACAISRELFERIGGFDPSFFLYHDDVDLSLRALLAGEPCLYVADAVVSHDYELSVPPLKWGWIEAHRYAVLLKALRLRTLLLLAPALVLLDVMTFTYLATRGRRFVSAKLRSYGWLLSNAMRIRLARSRAQSVRTMTDREVLGVLTAQIPYGQLASPAVAAAAALVVDPWFRLYHRCVASLVRW